MFNSYLTLPQQLLNRIKQMDDKSFKSIMQSYMTKRFTSIRINTLKSDQSYIYSQLSKLNIIYETFPWYDYALIIKNVNLSDIQKLDIYLNGSIYVQSLSSMIPPLIMDLNNNDLVLDITAAPGSKTTQIATLMHNQGKIIANDISRTRIYRLKANLENQGITNTEVINYPAYDLWKKYPEYFDKVLVDVPCSMEGRICISDQKSYQDWSTVKIKQLSEEQKWLLRSAVSCTKIGGIIVYSTCTMAPEENESVVDWILKKESKSLEIMEIKLPNLALSDSFTSWNGKNYSYNTKYTKRIKPNELFEGFFIAKFKKLKGNIPHISE